MTVKASLSSVPAYQRYGFTLAGNVGEFAGLVYQPVEKRLPAQAQSVAALQPAINRCRFTRRVNTARFAACFGWDPYTPAWAHAARLQSGFAAATPP